MDKNEKSSISPDEYLDLFGKAMQKLEIIPRTHQSSKTRETSAQTRVHAFREPILCRGIDCKVQFLPKRKDQVYCSLICKSKYFKIARSIGVILLEKGRCDSSLKVIVDCLLEILKTSGQSEETE